jgi:NADH:ubiquinone oxidoreductase subunit 3 (subunit A)
MNVILSPPLAFLIYIPLVLVIAWIGRKLAGPEPQGASEMKTELYGSGEEAAATTASPGYKPFFVIAFFFAILHLGMLVLGSAPLNEIAIYFLIGLLLTLVALILG